MKRKQKKTKFFIQDWAGNDKTDYYGEFDSFEEAWGALYREFDSLPEKEFEEQMGEFDVLERKSERKEKRYLDPFDPRG